MVEHDTSGEPLALVVVVEVGGAGAREFDNDKLAPMLESMVATSPTGLLSSHSTVRRD